MCMCVCVFIDSIHALRSHNGKQRLEGCVCVCVYWPTPRTCTRASLLYRNNAHPRKSYNNVYDYVNLQATVRSDIPI